MGRDWKSHPPDWEMRYPAAFPCKGKRKGGGRKEGGRGCGWRASGAVSAVEPIAGFALRVHDGENEELPGILGVENRIGKAPDKATTDAVVKLHPKVGEFSGKSDGRFDFLQKSQPKSRLDGVVVGDGLKEFFPGRWME